MPNFERREVEWSPHGISSLWNFYAETRGHRDHFFSKHSGASILQHVRRHLNIQGKRIIDFGCGPGFFIEHLLKKNPFSIRGIDFSEASVKLVQQKFLGRKEFTEAIAAKTLPSRLPEASADVLFAIEVVEHLEDSTLQDVLREFHRLLAPNGFVVITTPHQENLETEKVLCPECGCIFHRWQHVRSWTAEALTRTLEKAGFQTRHVAGTHFALPKSSLLRNLFLGYLKVRKVPFNTTPHLIFIGQK